MSALFHTSVTPNVTVPHEATSPEFYSWCAQLAREAYSSLYVLRDEKGYTKIVLERGTNGRLDATIECSKISFEDVERIAYAALRNLEEDGSHTVRWTSRGVRAFLRADWTKCFTGRVNKKTPAEFDTNSCRPWRCQPIADLPKNSSTPDPWDDEVLAAVGC